MAPTRTSKIVMTGAAGLAALGVGVAIDPSIASAVTTSTAVVTGRVADIKNALTGLVKDGTLTQAQADKVATTLDKAMPKRGMGDRGFGGGFGRGADLQTAASAIGITSDQLRTALESGKTLAQVAVGKGVSQATLVDKMVAVAQTRIAAAVKAGQLTAAQASSMTADLKSRITAQVTSTRPAGGGHRGGGWGGPQGGGVGENGGSAQPAPSTSPAAPPMGATTS